MGVVKPWAGRVFLEGEDVTEVPPHKRSSWEWLLFLRAAAYSPI